MHDPRASRIAARHARLLAAALAAAALAGCATAKQKSVVWPPPPETPRIKWVRTFATEDDLGGSGFRALGRVFIPGDPEAAIAQPTGLALSPDEKTLYVTCNAARRVLAVNVEKGTLRRVALPDDSLPGGPFGVAVDAEGNLYVSDHGKNVVWVYRPDGGLLRRFGEEKLERPTGIAIDRRRQVVYVTSGVSTTSTHHRVEVFSLQGKHLRTIGTRGHGPGEFNFPANLAVSRDGNLLVADMLNFRIQTFDPDGQLLGMFGGIGAGRPGVFDKLKSIGFDAFGNLYAVDSAQALVQIFNAQLQPLMAFAGRADAPGHLRVPNAIAITSTNRIFIADFALEAVSEYQLFNTTAADSFTPPDEPKAGSPKPAGPGTGQKPQGG
jgi:sugar lactone lactonase YvrE